MNIPFLDLKRQYNLIKNEISDKFNQILESQWFILGENVEKFEEEFAKYCNSKYGIGVASGTDALTLSIKSLGIGNGDEVITVPNTFTATVDAIVRNGAKPIFVDIEKESYNIDIDKIEEKITNKTKAIMPVHLYGQPANMDPILEIAKEKNLFVIEDACQAHGAEYNGKRVGSLGDIGCFSFFPGKNLGAYGDGGIIVTNNNELAEKLKMMRNYGQRKKYYHDFVGHNSRLDEIQACVLRIKLNHLDEWTNQRRKNAEKYNELLKNINEVETPIEKSFAKHVYHLYVIRYEDRDGLKNHLNSKGISTGLHYPRPIHVQKAYQFLGYRNGSFPITEKYSEEILSLPMFPELKEEEIEYVTKCIEEFVSKN